ncbi:MAG: glycosyltransferase family 4 protein [Gemmatimonadales bacterium]
MAPANPVEGGRRRPTETNIAHEPLRVLHVAAPADAGGLESVVRALSAGQAARGHAVLVAAVIAPGRTEHPFVAALRDAGIGVRVIEIPARAYLKERGALARLIEEFHSGVVHTHGYRPDLLARDLAQRSGAAAVTTVHGFTGGDWKNRTYEWLQRRSYRWFDAVVAVNQLLADRLVREGIGRERVHCIPNAWSGRDQLPRSTARARLGLSPDRFVVGWVGRLSREKGLDVLLAALPWLSDLPFEVSIIGTGRNQAHLQRLAESLGVASRLHWHGAVPEAGSLASAFDLFVLSSRTEGTPIVLFEAMAAGVPVVATAVGGVPEVLTADGGLLVAPEAPGALAQAVRSVLQDPGAAARRAAVARLRLQTDYTLDPWLTRYDEVYRTVRPPFRNPNP